MADDIERLKARVKREKNARKQAEEILEQKSVELFNSNNELLELTKNLEARVTERTAELQMAHDEAIRLAEIKSDFLANMSHELRTPLNGVLGMLTLLQNTDLSHKQVKLIQTAVNSGELLLALINDVLDLSKLENDKLDLENIPFEPAELIQFTCEPFASQAVAKGVDLIYLIAPDMPIALMGDPTRIKQIITNIVSNAIKFTEQGEILISTHYDDGEYIIAISDTGIGMTSEQLDKVLDKFSQANESTTRKFGGTGLGLTICQKLVDAMSGMLSITSEAGKGSCFEVSLPLKQQQGDVELIFPTELTEKKVLIAFPNPHLLNYMETLLRFWHIDEVIKVESFQQANDALSNRNDLDLVIYDFRIDSHGNNLLEIARKHLTDFQAISYWLAGTSIHNEIDHTMLTLPIKQSDLYDALMQCPDCGLRSDFDTNLLPTQMRYTNAKVLLTEDNLVNQEVARELLILFGCEVSVANNGEESVHKLQQSDFDLVLMDIQMPVMDGITAAKTIRALPEHKYRDIPIIALTAHSLHGDREKSLAAGMNDHITKPIELNQLSRVLADFLPDKQTKLEGSKLLEPPPIEEDRQTIQSIESPQTEYPGLNIESAMERVLNNMDLYKKILVTFVESLHEHISELKKPYTQANKDNLIRAAHTIKGSGANIGADLIMSCAGEVEFFLKSHPTINNDDLPRYSNLLNELYAKADEVELSINKFLEDKSEQKIEKNLLSNNEIVAICDNIKQSLYSDITEVEGYIAKLKSCGKSEIEELISKLSLSYNSFDYALIEQNCDDILAEVQNEQ